MIAVVFLVAMALVIGAVSMFGPAGHAATAAGAVPWWALATVLGAFVAFFAGGIHVGAALAIAALLAGKIEPEEGMLILVSGGNVDPDGFASVLAGRD